MSTERTQKERMLILVKVVSIILDFRCEPDERILKSMVNDIKEEATKYFGDDFIEDIWSEDYYEFVNQIEHLAIEFLEYNIATLPSKW